MLLYECLFRTHEEAGLLYYLCQKLQIAEVQFHFVIRGDKWCAWNTIKVTPGSGTPDMDECTMLCDRDFRYPSEYVNS